MGLDAADVLDRQPRREAGILAEILRISTVQGRAQEVHARPEHDILAALAGLLADHLAIGVRRLRIPGRRQGEHHGHERREVIRAPGRIPVVGLDVLAHAVRPIGHPAARQAEAGNRRSRELRIAVHEGQLFVERQAGEQVLDPHLDRPHRIQIRRPFVRRAGARCHREHRDRNRRGRRHPKQPRLKPRPEYRR